jgi:diadenosine tetraphosphate (Ap4A) HIT family hydrolase
MWCVFSGNSPYTRHTPSPTATVVADALNPPIQLVIPKFHGAKLHDVPNQYLSDILPMVKKLAEATGATDYNVLQNNGTIAHQQVHHVRLQLIAPRQLQARDMHADSHRSTSTWYALLRLLSRLSGPSCYSDEKLTRPVDSQA